MWRHHLSKQAYASTTNAAQRYQQRRKTQQAQATEPVAAATVVTVTARSAICSAPPPPPPAAPEQNTPQEAETMLSTRTKHSHASNPGSSSKRRTPKRKMYLVILSWIELLLSALNSSAKISSNRDETKSTAPRPVSSCSQQPVTGTPASSSSTGQQASTYRQLWQKGAYCKAEICFGVEKMHFGCW